MFELGKQQRQGASPVGQRRSARRASIVSICSAIKPRRCATARCSGGMRPEQIIIGKDHADLAERLRAQVKRGDWLLFKGSRGMKMEKVLDELKGGKA